MTKKQIKEASDWLKTLTRAQMRELAEIGFNTRQLATHECTEDGIPIFRYPSATLSRCCLER